MHQCIRIKMKSNKKGTLIPYSGLRPMKKLNFLLSVNYTCNKRLNAIQKNFQRNKEYAFWYWFFYLFEKSLFITVLFGYLYSFSLVILLINLLAKSELYFILLPFQFLYFNDPKLIARERLSNSPKVPRDWHSIA